ncbi:hypothetical protein [Bacillus sp. CGMCC 1.16541]|nr:hypothetical protein [Bacillus sp. CGMCC 1.16541]
MAQTRYVVCHGSATRDGEKLSVITIYEPGVPKQQIKEDLPYTKN